MSDGGIDYLYDDALPAGLLGETDLWIRAVLDATNTSGTTAPWARATAQWCRSLEGDGVDVFQLHVDLVPEPATAVLLGALVMSHWILDLLTHRPDLPLTLWSDFKVGLGLWDSVVLTLIIEIAIFAAGAYLYLRVTRANNKTGNIAAWSLLVFLFIVYLMNVFGPPPPSEEPIGYMGLAMWLLVAWGYWIDKNRSA